MRTKLLGTALIVLVLLGGLQVFQNLTRASDFGADGEFQFSSAQTVVEGVISKVSLNSEMLNSDQAEVMIQKTFKVRAGGALLVDIAHADVDIQTGNSSEAVVTVTLNSRNMSKAREKFERMEWEVYEEGGNVHLKAESPRGNWNVSMDIDVSISIPSKFNINLETSHGDVNLDDVNGMIDLHTSHGDVDFSEVQGERISFRSSHGDITGNVIRSAMVDVETSHADIEIREVDSKRMRASTSHANIEIDYLAGEADISTSHGNIEVFLVGNDSASFSTQHGDIDVSMDTKAGADLDLRAPQIRLDRDMKVNGEKTKKRVEGSVNGGGRSIRARTTHGSIALSGK